MQATPRRRSYFVVWAVLASCLIWGLVTLELIRSYHAIIDAAKSRNASVASLTAQRLNGALREIDYIMRDVQDYLDESLLKYPDTPDGENTRWLNDVLTKKIQTHPWLFAVGVMNAKGVFIASVNRNTAQEVGADFSRREYFTYPAMHPESTGFCSGAYVETTTNDVWFSCSRAIRLDGGKRFAGVVVSGLDGKYMQGLFGKSGFATGGAIAVADAAGRLLFRAPEIPGAAGKKMAFPELDRFQAGKVEATQFIGTSPLDGQERIFAFRKVEAFPYTVIVSSPAGDDLHQWRIQRYSYVAGFASIAGLLLGLSFLAGRLQRANIRLEEQAEELARQAHTDPLTGVSNRRHFFEEAAREIARSLRNNKPLALLMLDIDRFKGINDAHGHNTGDAVLKALCATSLATVRTIDVFARIGGEEFAVLLPETSGKEAELVAERLRARLAITPVDLPGEKSVSFTVSIGVSVMRPGEGSCEEILKRADTALYEAKNTGRNKVCVID